MYSKNSESRSAVSDSLPPHRLYSPWNSPGQNTGVDSCSLLQGIFPTQALSPGPVHCRWILYQLSCPCQILCRRSQDPNGSPCEGLIFQMLLLLLSCFSRVQFCATPWTAACQASVSFTISWSLLRLMSLESVMPSNHLVLYCPLLLPSVFPSIGVFSNESALGIRWPKYWSFSFNISPSNEHSGLFPM